MPDDWRLIPEVTLTSLPQAADELLARSNDKRIWLFYGEMGAGKTTLIKAIARKLGVEEVMSSPTFSLVNEYGAGSRRIYHMDLYRLASERELLDIGIEEYFASGGYCFVEWPEKLGRLEPPDAMRVRISTTGEQLRKIEYQTV